MPSDTEIDALISDVVDEMDLCRNDGAWDIAALLDRVAGALAAMGDELKEKRRIADYETEVAAAEIEGRKVAESRARELEQKLERARVELTDVTACVENRKAIYEALLEKASVWAEPEYMRWDMLKYVVEAFEILEKEISPARATLAEIGQRG